MTALRTTDEVFGPGSAAGNSAADAGGGPPACKVWVDRPASFSTREAGAFHHTFHLHPLMQLPRLAELAQALWPRGQCRFITPDATDSSSMESSIRLRSPDGRRVDEVLRHIEQPGAWIALYNVESDPGYKAFLAEVMQAAGPVLGPRRAGIFRVCGYIFISAPPSVTPFHIDRENNFWLQLRGRKTITVWDPADHEIVAPEAVEKFLLTGSLEDVKLADEFRARGRVFDCGPGDGVYFPSTSPHMTRSDPAWARPGDGVAVSMGVVFYTAETLRQARVHLCNHEMRRRGMNPTPPGRYRLLDAVKAPVGSLLAQRREEWPDVTGWSFGRGD